LKKPIYLKTAGVQCPMHDEFVIPAIKTTKTDNQQECGVNQFQQKETPKTNNCSKNVYH
jgi:hypothetical protein